MANLAEEELEQKRNGIQFACSTNKIEIPEEFKTIVIRANFGNKSPLLAASEWPTSGSVYSTGKRGLFGLRLSQDLHYIESISFSFPYPTYMILEVDERTIKEAYGDCEFLGCNILFSGRISEFLESLRAYATVDQYAQISELLGWKLRETTKSMESIETLKEYILKSLSRARLMKIMINEGF
jgi:hypothetical protein